MNSSLSDLGYGQGPQWRGNCTAESGQCGRRVSETSAGVSSVDSFSRNKKALDVTELEQTAPGEHLDH